MEHPSSLEDAIEWNVHKIAIAQLASPDIKELEGSEEGRKKLERLQKLAAKKIDSSTTWVNLDHAVMISEVRTKELLNPKLKVTTSVIDHSDK